MSCICEANECFIRYEDDFDDKCEEIRRITLMQEAPLA
jgi:hypothetical protein